MRDEYVEQRGSRYVPQPCLRASSLTLSCIECAKRLFLSRFTSYPSNSRSAFFSTFHLSRYTGDPQV